MRALSKLHRNGFAALRQLAAEFRGLVAYAQQNGHAAGVTEWGGCNDSQPYHANITSFAQAHSLPLIYFDNTYLITLSAAIAADSHWNASGAVVHRDGCGRARVVTSVSSTSGAAALARKPSRPHLAPISRPCPAGKSVPLPTTLGGTSVLVTTLTV